MELHTHARAFKAYKLGVINLNYKSSYRNIRSQETRNKGEAETKISKRIPSKPCEESI